MPAIGPVAAAGRIEPLADGRWALQLEVHAGDVVTRHRAEASTCGELGEAVALQVAMALGVVEAPEHEPTAEAIEVPTPPVESSPASISPPIAARAAPPTVRSRVEPRERVDRRKTSARIGVRARGGVGTGRVPRIDGRVGAAVGVIWPRARLELVADHTFVQPRQHPERAGLEVRVWQWTGGMRGCWTPHVGPIEVPVCAGLESGASRATSRGVTRPRTATSAWVAATAGPAIAWPIRQRLALWLEVDGWVAFTQAAFTVDGLAPWFVTRRGGVDARLGVEVRLP